jgi:hypothetical protein
MPIPRDKVELAALFKRLGAPSSGGWARSQFEEGINQMHRFLFLRQLWARVVAEGDESWIDEAMTDSSRDGNAPFSGVGHSLKRLHQSGAQRKDLVELVRGMQARLLSEFCYLLDDPSLLEDELKDFGWALVETDADFEPTARTIAGLHESVLGTDPTGLEMRPRTSL